MDLEILSLLKTPLKELIQEPTTDLIAYKAFGALANNALTLKITLLCADWVSSFFEFSATDRIALIDKVKATKPNENGFDIHIESPRKILVEVKALTPINNGDKYGSAQKAAILDDALKLKKGKKNITNTNDYLKIIALLNCPYNAVTKLVTPPNRISTTSKKS